MAAKLLAQYELPQETSRLASKCGYAIFLHQPCRRSIMVGINDGKKFNEFRYFLSFPPMISLFYYVGDNNADVHLVRFSLAFLKNKEISLETFLETSVYYPPFPNIFSSDLSCCLGDQAISGKSLEDIAKKVHTAWWTNSFDFFEMRRNEFLETYDGPDAYYEDHCENSFALYKNYLQEWENKTKANPRWIPDDFKEFDTLRNFIDAFGAFSLSQRIGASYVVRQ